jgi:hypothetical protein
MYVCMCRDGIAFIIVLALEYTTVQYVYSSRSSGMNRGAQVSCKRVLRLNLGIDDHPSNIRFYQVCLREGFFPL